MKTPRGSPLAGLWSSWKRLEGQESVMRQHPAPKQNRLPEADCPAVVRGPGPCPCFQMTFLDRATGSQLEYSLNVLRRRTKPRPLPLLQSAQQVAGSPSRATGYSKSVSQGTQREANRSWETHLASYPQPAVPSHEFQRSNIALNRWHCPPSDALLRKRNPKNLWHPEAGVVVVFEQTGMHL